MHSGGRGEESPDAYRGVVLPSEQPGQQQAPAPYGDQVRPAGGNPWDAPAAQAPAPGQPGPPQAQPYPQPQAADATQMLPPYPAGTPVPGPGGPGAGPGPGGAVFGAPLPAAPPVADATQMLPPYPGAAPAGPQQAAGPGAGPVPPLPPVPPAPPHVPQAAGVPQAPPQQAPGGPPVPPHAGPPPAEAVDATQALPSLSIFEEPQPYGQEYPQAYGQEPGGFPQQAPPPAPDSDYDHLFRNDVPAPAPLRQRIIQPPSAQQKSGAPVPGQAPYGQGAAMPPYGQQGYDTGYGYGDDREDSGGRRRLSPKVLIGIVVAGCVVTGLVVGGLLNSGGGGADNAGDKTSSPTASAPATGAATAGSTGDGDSTGGTADSAAKQQAQALDSLLQSSGSSRSSVVNAVGSVKNCDNLAGSASALRSASGQRTGLVTKLGTLSVDKLSGHADLTDALTKAWQASAAADSHYANWADQVRRNHKLCKDGHARFTAEVQAGDRSSGAATQQKKRAVRLWNAIARQYGLTQRQFSQL